MKTRKVTDKFGRILDIDEETKKLYTFSNEDKTIVYNAEIVENGKLSGFWTDYEETGIVTEIEEKLQSFENKLMLIYASSVNFYASKNDPDRKIYKDFVEYIKENENKFFTKTGDFRKKFLINDKDILEMIKINRR